jgi:dihydrofolate reductase
MAKLIYSPITSLDGYVADEKGNFDWAAPDKEVHAFVNDVERPIGTYLYGRGMYEVMRYWETADAVDGRLSFVREYAEIWRSADKSCTRARSRLRQPIGRGSSVISTRMRFDA